MTTSASEFPSGTPGHGTSNEEGYSADWVRLELMVGPAGEYYAVGGDREPGEGDRPYLGLARMKRRFVAQLKEAALQFSQGARDGMELVRMIQQVKP